ncbi:MAG: hypothetical protein AVDCRST_MAG90-1319, partial [uncultured Microvirga sp.]
MRIGDPQVLDHERPGEAEVLQGRLGILDRKQALRSEMLHDLIVLHLDVETHLIPVDQFLQGRRQLTIGRDDGDELTDVELPFQSEIAPDGVEEERGHLREEIVQELDHELPPVDAEAD